jgi:hypothetical protein
VAGLFPVPIAYFLCVPDLVSAVPGLPETPFLETRPRLAGGHTPLILAIRLSLRRLYSSLTFVPCPAKVAQQGEESDFALGLPD